MWNSHKKKEQGKSLAINETRKTTDFKSHQNVKWIFWKKLAK